MKSIAATIWIIGLLAMALISLPAQAAAPVSLAQLISTNGSLTVGNKKFSDFGFQGDTNQLNLTNILVETPFSPNGFLGLNFTGNITAQGRELNFALFYTIQLTNGLPLISGIGQSVVLATTGNGGLAVIGETVWRQGFFVGPVVAQSSIGQDDFVDPAGESLQGDDLIIDPPLSKVWITETVHLAPANTNSSVGILRLDQFFCQNILSLTCGTNKTVECGTAWDFSAPTAENSCCSSPITIAVVSTVTNAICGNTFAATRTWLATDGCSNSAVCSQTVTLVDTIPPVIICAPSRFVECGVPWAFDPPSASDLCDNTNVTITIVSTVTNGLCGNTFTATRTWRATDGCSNSAVCSQTVTILDTTPPVIACAANRSVECGVPWTFDPPSATDICDDTNVTITIVSTVTNGLCGNTFAATRTWRATDSCSNSAVCSQTVTIVDTTPPVITCVPNRIVECGVAWAFDPPSATDICDDTNVIITIVGTVTNGLCGNTFAATRTWRATDSCSNSAICSQTVTIIDTTSPVITCVPNRIVECGVAWAFDPPSATDICDDTNVIITIVGTVTNGLCGNTFAATRTWRATDSCSNSAICSQTVTIIDTMPPVITCVPNSIVECGVAWAFDPPSATDICDDTNVTITIVGTVTNGLCGNTFAATRTWRAMDSCSNSAVCSQTVTIIDTTSPVITCVPNRIVECGVTWAFDPPSATDICDGTNVIVTIVSTVTNGLCGNTFAATRTWRATDSCSNSAVCSQTVTILDTTAPVILCAVDRSVECGVTWAFDPPSATDICDGTNVTITIVGTLTNALCGNTFTATRTWRATDSCSNSSTCSQTVTILDTTSPVILCAANRSVECGTAWNFNPPAATDICDDTNVTITIVGTVTNGLCGNTFTATRTWRATDSCSNSAVCSQTVTVIDTTAPVLACASDRVVECGVAWNFDIPGATDICDGTNVTLTIVSTVTNGAVGQIFSALRTWQATDSCSNSSVCSQRVTIVDTTPPQISCSTNVIVECPCTTGTQVFFNTTVFDGCDTNVGLVCTPPSGSTFVPGVSTVRCAATDDSGNTNGCSFTVTVHDTTDCQPLITCSPDINATEFPRDHGAATLTYVAPVTRDFCNNPLTVACVPPSGSSFPLGKTTVTCTVRDNHQRTNTCSFVIRVIAYRLTVTSPADSGPGTLRQALLDANDAPGENLIAFNLAGPAPHILHLLTPLPAVTSPVILDGASQPGFGGRPIVELDGSALAGADGLVINAGRSTVRSLALTGFGTAIRLQTNGGNLVLGNYLGVDASGTNGPGNSADGLYISSMANQIGGAAPNEGNVISGNGGSGVHFDTAGAVSNLVVGNFIGTARDGATALGNGQDGVRIGNDAARNIIGGITPGAGNVIAFNQRNGVLLDADAGTGNAIRANAILANGTLGIDLGADGPTPNDAEDADAGPNNRQNYPVLSDARSADGVTTIDGTLNGVLGATYRLDFYLDTTGDPLAPGQGAVYIGSATVANQGSGEFSASFPLPTTFVQFVTATATDPGNNTSEFSPPVPVRTPPVLEVEPVGTNAAPGAPVTLCARASGTPPIFYQWRINGENIPDATNSCYEIPSAQAANGGTYTVVVVNELGAVRTGQAALRLPFPNLQAGDNFVDRVPLSSTGAVVSSANRLATKEPGEPNHAGKRGGKSVWYTWEAPSTGVASVGTRGSTFDTLLAVYRGKTVSNLVVVASDEDRGGFFTSGLRFNAIKDHKYHFAIDGYYGEEGDFIFGLSHFKTDHLLPVILTQPVSRTVAAGTRVTFTVVADYDEEDEDDDDNGHVLRYQWLLNGTPIAGATRSTLTISNVQPESVGTYTAQVSTRHWTVESADASLQINEIGSFVEPVQAMDKFLDAVNSSTPLRLGTPGGSFAPAAIVRGYTGTQVFNTAGATTSSGDEIICGVLGGASEWISFVAEEEGTLSLNTDGSTYNTVMAVFRRSSTNAAVLQLLGCDNNGGVDGRDSALTVPVEGGRTNFIVVDGVNGAVGTLRLNFSLLTAGRVISVGFSRQQGYQLQFVGRPVAKFALQTSTNLKNWTTLMTTTNPSTGLFNFFDSSATNAPVRFYRSQSLP